MVIDGLDYGPIGAMVGTWTGDKGLDTSAEPMGEEKVVYRETIVFEAAGWVKNGGEQTLSIVRYHQSVNRVDTGEGFHDQVGYWTWDPADGHHRTVPDDPPRPEARPGGRQGRGHRHGAGGFRNIRRSRLGHLPVTLPHRQGQDRRLPPSHGDPRRRPQVQPDDIARNLWAGVRAYGRERASQSLRLRLGLFMRLGRRRASRACPAPVPGQGGGLRPPHPSEI
jgi:hypothetical protein